DLSLANHQVVFVVGLVHRRHKSDGEFLMRRIERRGAQRATADLQVSSGDLRENGCPAWQADELGRQPLRLEMTSLMRNAEGREGSGRDKTDLYDGLRRNGADSSKQSGNYQESPKQEYPPSHRHARRRSESRAGSSGHPDTIRKQPRFPLSRE